MRRADRLLDLVARLKAKPLVTADELSSAMGISTRTVYRDLAALQGQGLPIEGQAGVGYMLRGDIDMPPLTFTHHQLEALALGLAYVEQVGDAALADAARDARAKVDSAWAGQPTAPPSDRRLRARQRPEHRAPACAEMIRSALRTRRQIVFGYQDAQERITTRTVRPLALTAYFDGWMLVAWCPQRSDFRHFRLDRMHDVMLTDLGFPDEPERDLGAYLQLHARQTEAAALMKFSASE
jgi:predicted DNA-binding transcriptional regulator YafY